MAECVGMEFWRLRLGIGHPGPGLREQVIGYVLRRPPTAEHEDIVAAVTAAADALQVFLDKGAERAKTQLHSRHPTKRVPDDEDSEGTG